MRSLEEVLALLDGAKTVDEKKKVMDDLLGEMTILEVAKPLIAMTMEMAVRNNVPKMAVIMTRLVIPMINTLDEALPPEDKYAAKHNIMDLTNLLSNSEVSMHLIKHTSDGDEADCDHDCENCKHAVPRIVNPAEMIKEMMSGGGMSPSLGKLLDLLRSGGGKVVAMGESHPIGDPSKKTTIH